MKRYIGISAKIVLLIFSVAVLAACKNKAEKPETEESVALNQESVVSLAKQIVYAVNRGDNEFFNMAFNKDYIKTKISDNSLVFSSLDTDFGKEFFEYCFHQGDFAVGAVNNGGDFNFLKYYEEDGEHHVIFRTYQNYGVKIEDFIVDTIGGELKIIDGFSYNMSATFSDQVKYSVLLNVLQKTDASDVTHIFTESDNLIKEKKYDEAFALLDKNAELLGEYPYFTQSYLQTAFMAKPLKFIEFLDGQQLDERTILIHKLLYYTNGGYLKESEEIINRLIDYTGDDPIYLFMYARANVIAKKYNDALVCLENLGNALPPLWDVTLTALTCYEKTANDSLFVETMLSAKDIYGMTDDEILEFASADFPSMVKKVQEEISAKK